MSIGSCSGDGVQADLTLRSLLFAKQPRHLVKLVFSVSRSSSCYRRKMTNVQMILLPASLQLVGRL